MRNPKNHAPATTSEAAPVPGGASGLPAPPVQPPPVAPVAVAPRPPGPTIGRVQGPRPKKYRLLNGGYFTMGGHKTTMRIGKVVDGTQYNLEEMRRQGFKLQAVDDDGPLETFEAEPPKAVNQMPAMRDFDRHPTQLAEHELEQELAIHRGKGLRGDELEAEKARRDALKGTTPQSQPPAE